MKAWREFILEAEAKNWVESISGKKDKNVVNYGLNVLKKSGAKWCSFLSSAFL